jgi:hypothetical protein
VLILVSCLEPYIAIHLVEDLAALLGKSLDIFDHGFDSYRPVFLLYFLGFTEQTRWQANRPI